MSTLKEIPGSKGGRLARPERRAGGIVEVLRRWPFSTVLGLHLGPLVILPALIKQLPAWELVVTIASVAWASAFVAESLAPAQSPVTGRAVPSLRMAKTVLAIGVLAHVVFWLGGGNTYAVQLGERQSSWVAPLVAPLRVLVVLGSALVLIHIRRGGLTRRQGLLLFGGATGVIMFLGALGGIVGGAAGTASAILVVAALSGSIGKRGVMIALVGLLALWPALYVVREGVRASTVNVAVDDEGPGPWRRLQMDEQFAMVEHARSLRAVERPTAPELVRAAVIPRFLDPSRPPLDTATRMNRALGGTSKSARSATFFGNVYIFDGFGGVICVAGALGALSRLICLRLTGSPFSLALFGVIFQCCVSVNATYPEGFVAAGQGVMVIGAVWLLWRIRRGPRATVRRGRGAARRGAASALSSGGRMRPPRAPSSVLSR